MAFLIGHFTIKNGILKKFLGHIFEKILTKTENVIKITLNQSIESFGTEIAFRNCVPEL